MLALQIILLILNVTNAVVHTIGAYALISLYPASRHKPQRIYIINLAISEALVNSIEVIRDIPEFLTLSPESSILVQKMRNYLLMVSFIGVSFVYYFDMIYLTLDRLLKIWLSLKYPQYWNEDRAIYLLIGTWSVGFSLTLGLVIANVLNEFQWQLYVYRYFYPPLEFLYIIIAFATYWAIFQKYRSSNLRLSTISLASVNNMSMRPQRSLCQEFRRSFFFIPFLLISTYLVFMIIPDLTFLFEAVIKDKYSEDLQNLCWISYAVSNLLDAAIYIFFIKDVRLFLIDKLYKLSCRTRQPKESTMPLQAVLRGNR